MDGWPDNLLNKFNLNNCFTGATNIKNSSTKSKLEYSGYGIAFDGGGLWGFDNGFARNVIFGVVHSSSSHAGNQNNIILVILTYLHYNFGIGLILTSLKQRKNFAWVYITMVIIAICLLTKKKSLNLMPVMKMSTF